MTVVGLTVGELVAGPNLRTRIVSGSAGLDRVVLWAHSCELENPERWLGPNELLMTVGHCVPHKAADQRAFIARLDDAGLAGMAIGEHGTAPRLSKALHEEADKRGFPVLLTAPEIPFATMGRTVAAAASDNRTMGVLMLAKLYQLAGQRTPEARRSGRDLSDLMGVRIVVVDDATGCVLIGAGGVVASAESSGRAAQVHTLRTSPPSHLVLDVDDHLDGLAMLHLTQVLAVDVTAIRQDAAERLRVGAETLEAALTGHPGARRSLPSRWGDGTGGFRVLAATSTVPGRIPLAFALADLSTTLVESSDRVLAAIPSVELDRARALLSTLDATAGCSAEHWDLADLTGAAAEARSEHRVAMAHGAIWGEFVGESVSLLARSSSEAELICSAVLGPLVGADPRTTVLRETLFAFLDHDQRWSETARDLGLHRQSLVYRLKQVESATGRSLRRTQDLAEFWLARTAWSMLREKD